MIRTLLRYHDPASVDEACDLLAEHGDRAIVLGGGTLMVPMMTRGEVRPDHVVDLRGAGLREIVQEDGEVRIGARVTYAQASASDLLRDRLPLLAEMADGITGGTQLRNLATLVGSACHANPASDVPACLVALDARMEVRGPDGVRSVPAEDFFVNAFATNLRAGELVAGIAVPLGAGGHGYHKLKLCEGSWPIATAAAITAADGSVAVTLGGVCAVPVKVGLADATADIGDQVEPQLQDAWDDELATGDYRRAVAGVIARRALSAMTNGGR